MTTKAHSETSFVSTLPGHYYYDPAIYALEQERIFSRMWVCVGRADALTLPGAYQTVSLGGENVIVVRDKELKLRAFLNVCRHRGARLCPETSGVLKGSIQCRYHAWTYALNGRLIGAPNVLNETAFQAMDFSLLPVALEVWEGLVWLNLSETPEPIEQQIYGPIIERFVGSYERFAHYDVRHLKSGKTISYAVQANWKIVLENFQECYHCGPVHPEFCRYFPQYKSGVAYNGDEAATLAADMEAFSITGKANRPHLPGLVPEDLRRYYGIVINPNLLLNLFNDHVVIHTLTPLEPDCTRVTCDWLFDRKETERPDFDPADAVELFDLVNRQDWEVCALTQAGMTSRAYRNGGIYVPVEHHIRAFADFILEKCP
ncbi:MAG TPA: aromatic ring-hydroxylating dioxygenase subunit alpha [Ktedonobacteraceae bacterium]|nr:aromatic ring-hydroxylating dioxygenase subunit alpha [Ktedonobacteraceae bacterium]